MNDRYLFRGKRLDNGKWVQGDLLCDREGAPSHVRFWGKLGIDCADINPATIGQCTGLKDKNGELIFDGDIIRRRYGVDNEESANYVIIYADDASYAGLEIDGDPRLLSLNNSDVSIEIIGNVYDNRDLLEVK